MWHFSGHQALKDQNRNAIWDSKCDEYQSKLLVLINASWICLKFTLDLSDIDLLDLLEKSWRRLLRRLKDVLKTSWRCLEDVFED